MPWADLLVLALALGASALTLLSGFGLGTVLLPAFALVFPLDVAVAATAVVHLANNAAKTVLMGKGADRLVVLRFGLPATLASLAGAVTLLALGHHVLAAYDWLGHHEVTAVGLVLGTLVTLFALLDLVPRLRALRVERRHLALGGVASGYFGGLSGHQGALRSIFLGKLGLDARTFIATGTVCAMLVDVARLAVYGGAYARGAAGLDAHGWWLVAGAVACATAGAIAGVRLSGKVTIEAVRWVVGALLLVIGPLMAAGLV